MNTTEEYVKKLAAARSAFLEKREEELRKLGFTKEGAVAEAPEEWEGEGDA